MGNIVTQDSMAAVNAVGVENKAFALAISFRPQKILIVGAALAAKAGTYTANTPRRMYSADEAGARYGMGGPLHDACYWAFQGHKGAIPTYVAPQAENGSGVAATGTFEFTAACTVNGYLYVYINNTQYKIWCTTDDTISDLGDLLVAAMAADPMCPLTGVNTAGSVALTCKVKGTWGNDVSVTTNEKGEDTPTTMAFTITPMASGANDPSMSAVLSVLGSGDSSNEDGYTLIIPCYDRLGDTTMDALSVYNGTGNEIEGCYAETVHKPFVALYGDTDEGTSALTALNVIGAARRELDRTNGVVSVPGSPAHPTSIAAMAAGLVAKTAQVRPQEDYYGISMPLILPGTSSERWTNDYTNRASAVDNGVGTTLVVNGTVKLQNLLTFYHPESVPMGSNGYRAVADCMLTMSILQSHYDAFNTEEYQGISIVDDVSKVGSATAKEKARDRSTVLGTLIGLIDLFENEAWIYQGQWTKDRIAADLDTHIQLRSGGLGWDTILPLVYRGKGGMINGTVQFDVNLAVITG